MMSKNKMDTIVGGLRKICMGNHWEKNFDQSYLSGERRCRIVTHRYGYKALQLIRTNNFWIIFEIMLYCCSISYLRSLPACELDFNIFLLCWDMIDQIFFPNGCPYKFYGSPPVTVIYVFPRGSHFPTHISLGIRFSPHTYHYNNVPNHKSQWYMFPRIECNFPKPKHSLLSMSFPLEFPLEFSYQLCACCLHFLLH